jgi:hypothetical protein
MLAGAQAGVDAYSLDLCERVLRVAAAGEIYRVSVASVVK